MQYRPFGRLDWHVSALGFGCMRLPTNGDDSSHIDEPRAIDMIHYAIDQGVNYFDTAYPYHGGNSERVLGRALQGGRRDRVRIATKLPTWQVEETADFDKYLNEQLDKLQVEHIDFYLLHGLRAPRWETVKRLNILKQAEKAIADGRIGHLGFSFHDEYAVFQEIIDAFGGWSFCQIQYNYMNEQVQAGTKGLEYAAARGLAVVIMEPLLGGKLVDPPQPIQALWDTLPKKRSAANWALQWLWNKPEVSVVLSGMSTMEQVIENVASASQSGTKLLTATELERVAQVRDKYDELCPIPCTQCRYCMPCPNGVDIPHNFSVFNTGAMYDKFGEARRRYEQAAEDSRASACIQCRQCEDLCPQSIEISAWMPVVDQVLGQGQSYQDCALP
jgi:predicted aldo/keto reductase-like oxidoreductase